MAIFLVVMAVMHLTGISSIGSGLKVGWVENKGGAVWSSNYILFSGTYERKLNTGGSHDMLHVDITTKGGEFSLAVKDGNGDTIYAGEDLQTTSFDVKVEGEVTAVVTGRSHKGGFALNW